MSHSQRQREIFGGDPPGPSGPTPPRSVTLEVDVKVARVYLDAAHEAAKRAMKARRKVGDDGSHPATEEVGLFRSIAEGHMAACREALPDGCHIGGVQLPDENRRAVCRSCGLTSDDVDRSPEWFKKYHDPDACRRDRANVGYEVRE